MTTQVRSMQTSEELDAFYSIPDPWKYETTADDRMRLEMIFAHLPEKRFRRVLDIGCGNGFVTAELPGEEIVGVDVSENALKWARQRCFGSRFKFYKQGVLELAADQLGEFDLVVMTGVAYPQYIGDALSLLQLKIDAVLRNGGSLLHVHIADWFKGGFPYILLDRHLYPYRDRWHLLESYVK